MNFEEYLISKKIDSNAFKEAEEALWLAWKTEFEQIHPNSFTVQKLNMINPIRRKYQLKVAPKIVVDKTTPVGTDTETSTNTPATTATNATPPVAKPAVPRPVFKPKPKIN